jgi:hypothetical protein
MVGTGEVTEVKLFGIPPLSYEEGSLPEEWPSGKYFRQSAMENGTCVWVTASPVVTDRARDPAMLETAAERTPEHCPGGYGDAVHLATMRVMSSYCSSGLNC